jgi:SAM-dependent methyltransferase
MTTIQEAPVTVPQQAGAMLQLVAGYAGVRTIELGLGSGLVAALDRRPGATADGLAEELGLDDFYVGVWCRSAFAAGVLEREGDGYRLAPHLGTVLLDTGHPAYVGGIFPLVQQPEMFGRFGEVLASGDRLWWDETSPEWIARVSGTGRPFYTRLVPDGLARVPGLAERLEAGCRVVDHACGAGAGLVRLARAYPRCELVGVDGDAHSIARARATLEQEGLADRVELVVSPLEDVVLDRPADVVVNNISMHECRDIERATDRVREALVPGGWFVVSDFPFPDTDEGLRSVPGRVMCAIQFFEAQIDDQLLPRSAYDALLGRHGFVGVDHADLTPMHAITWGRAPA